LYNNRNNETIEDTINAQYQQAESVINPSSAVWKYTSRKKLLFLKMLTRQ
jgi:hypothetical protein